MAHQCLINNLNNKNMLEILNKIKIDQVAIATLDSEKLVNTFKKMGLTDWIHDEVVAIGDVRDDVNCTNSAKLNFNYQMGIEFEILEYIGGKSWHDEVRKLEGGANFLSHIGFHIHDQKEVIAGAGEITIPAEDILQELKEKIIKAGYKIVQEVWTDSHTNQYLIDQKRKYHYVIFDTREELGFDIKLIVRRQDA